MNHVTMDDDSRSTVEFAPSRIIDRLVVSVIAEQRRVIQIGNPPQIFYRGGRFHAKSKRRGIRCNYQAVFLPTLQRQCRHTKGPILINVVSVELTEGGLRDAPRHTVLSTIHNL